MPVEKSYARLGAFIMVTMLVVLLTAIFFIQRMKQRPAMSMVTFTTENVFGLDVSSPVRLRGVPVGRVTNIRVNPRGTLVEIDFEVYLDHLNTIGLDVHRLQTVRDIGGVFPNLRAQIMGNPMTGEAYLLLNQPTVVPAPMQLDFVPDRPYVPSMSSPFGMASERLPQLLDLADETLKTLTVLVGKMPDSFQRGQEFFTNADRIIRDSQLPQLSADSRKFYATTSAQMEQIKSDMDSVQSNELEVVKASQEARAFSSEARTALKEADLPGTTQAARAASDNAKLASDDIRRSLPAIQTSLSQLNELTRQLQEQPEAVIYGPQQQQAKHK